MHVELVHCWAPSERASHHLKGKLSLHEVSSHPVFRVSILLILQDQIDKGKKAFSPAKVSWQF